MTRNEYVDYKLKRSGQALMIAKKLLDDGVYEDAINRIYYSVFYAVSALLYVQKLYPKTHRGVKTLFNKEFVQTGLINKAFEDFYSSIFARRFEADYEDFFTIDFEKTQEYYNNAQKLIEIIKHLISNTPEK